MLSKAQNKYIRSLTQQKYRKEHKAFVVEGDKMVREWLETGQEVQLIAATEKWASVHESLINKLPTPTVYIIKEHELQAISGLQTANQVLLVAAMPDELPIVWRKQWYIALQDIQDPGNMGTIMRTADWFGIRDVICSQDCVDAYNPKVVQAAMGSHLRIQIHTADIGEVIKQSQLPAIAAVMNGANIYNIQPMEAGIIMIGNEGKGMTDKLISHATYKVTIPRKGGAESLNAGVATGILCSILTNK
ncbi:MAG: RNA methyltransferase [Taibaiella sp.]|nr:RNA methyltransferase [Taibaiella sp.]